MATLIRSRAERALRRQFLALALALIATGASTVVAAKTVASGARLETLPCVLIVGSVLVYALARAAQALRSVTWRRWRAEIRAGLKRAATLPASPAITRVSEPPPGDRGPLVLVAPRHRLWSVHGGAAETRAWLHELFTEHPLAAFVVPRDALDGVELKETWAQPVSVAWVIEHGLGIALPPSPVALYSTILGLPYAELVRAITGKGAVVAPDASPPAGVGRAARCFGLAVRVRGATVVARGHLAPPAGRGRHRGRSGICVEIPPELGEAAVHAHRAVWAPGARLVVWLPDAVLDGPAARDLRRRVRRACARSGARIPARRGEG